MEYDECRSNLVEVSEYYQSNKDDRNEASTRLQLINRILFECLNWDEDDCVAEERENGKYTDYTLSTIKRVLIVEAKKEGIYFELPEGVNNEIYKISSLLRDYESLGSAIKQAMGYCQRRGVQIGCVCNGHQIVAFIASRSDGISPYEGKALVYESFDAMLDRFQQLWNCLSKDGIIARNLVNKLTDVEEKNIPPKLSSTIRNYPGTKDRNPFQTSISILSDIVLQDIPESPEAEEEFLEECYCESGALSQYAKISKDILSERYELLTDLSDENKFGEDVPKPTVESAVEKGGEVEIPTGGMGRRPILLIGDVGVGKTMFIKNLVTVRAGDVLDNAVVIHINLGQEGALSKDLRSLILKNIKDQLYEKYDINVDSADFAKSVHHKRLERFRDSPEGQLYDIDREKYRKEEIKLLNELMDNTTEHLKKCVRHIAKGRERQVVIFIDNADQRSDETQEKAFLIAQELASKWLASVFLTLRPETYHQSLDSGALSGYQPRVFTISPPRVDRVLEKRLDFALRIATGELPYGQHLSETTTYGEFHSLEALLRALLHSLNINEDLVEAFDNMSGGNIRAALNYIRDFMGSGHVDTEKIAQIQSEEGRYRVPVHEFLRAIIFRENKYYDPSKSPVANLFDIYNDKPRSHFALPIALSYVNAKSHSNGESSFCELSNVFGFLQELGFTSVTIDKSLSMAYNKDLVVTSGRKEIVDDNKYPESIRITTIGAYHVKFLIKKFVYIDAVIIDTPIISDNIRKRIHTLESGDIRKRLKRGDVFLNYLDMAWNKSSIENIYFDWPKISKEINANINQIKRSI